MTMPLAASEIHLGLQDRLRFLVDACADDPDDPDWPRLKTKSQWLYDVLTKALA